MGRTLASQKDAGFEFQLQDTLLWDSSETQLKLKRSHQPQREGATIRNVDILDFVLLTPPTQGSELMSYCFPDMLNTYGGPGLG